MPTIVITGASQGLGAAIAEAFTTEADIKLALLARNEANLEAVAARCRLRGAEVQVFPCDVTQAAEVQAVADQVLATWEQVDVLVNNAGLFRPSSILDISIEAFQDQIHVNLTSAFLVTKAFLPKMVEAQWGHIFFMASVASIRAYAGGAAYCAAKHGLLGLARVVREETKPKGIRVTTLLPGATLTESWAGTTEPETRFMRPEDIAETVLQAWKLSERSVVEEIILRPQLGDF